MITKASIRQFVLAVALPLTAIVSQRAHAAFTLTLQQVGNDVVLTGSGTIDLSALSLAGSNANGEPLINPHSGALYGGPTSNTPVDEYVGINGPGSFGRSYTTLATSGSGSDLGLGSFGYLVVPSGYDSGTAVSESATFANQTFASLGFTRERALTRGALGRTRLADPHQRRSRARTGHLVVRRAAVGLGGRDPAPPDCPVSLRLGPC